MRETCGSPVLASARRPAARAAPPTPAYPVVVEVLAVLRAKDLDHHAVEMQALHQHPGEGAQEEEVQKHGQHLAGHLGSGTGRRSALPGCVRWESPVVSASWHPFLGASSGHAASFSS